MLQDSIVAKASEMFLSMGLKTVSMDDIAKSLGISKRTLYENFSSKDELLSVCIDSIEKAQKKKFEELSKGAVDIIDMIVIFSRESLESLKQVSPIFFQDLNLYHFRLANDLYNKQREEKKNKTRYYLQRGIAEGYILPDIDVDFVSELDQIWHKGIVSLMSSRRFSYEKLFKHTILMCIRGIATEKGIRCLDEKLKDLLKD